MTAYSEIIPLICIFEVLTLIINYERRIFD